MNTPSIFRARRYGKNVFTIFTQIATQLVITTQPSGAVDNAAFTTQPRIEARDAGNVLVSSFTNNITASIATGSGTLIGVKILACVGGVATYSGLSLSPSGTYTLGFAASGLMGATSSSLSVASSGGITPPFEPDATDTILWDGAAVAASPYVKNTRTCSGEVNLWPGDEVETDDIFINAPLAVQQTFSNIAFDNTGQFIQNRGGDPAFKDANDAFPATAAGDSLLLTSGGITPNLPIWIRALDQANVLHVYQSGADAIIDCPDAALWDVGDYITCFSINDVISGVISSITGNLIRVTNGWALNPVEARLLIYISINPAVVSTAVNGSDASKTDIIFSGSLKPMAVGTLFDGSGFTGNATALNTPGIVITAINRSTKTITVSVTTAGSSVGVGAIKMNMLNCSTDRDFVRHGPLAQIGVPNTTGCVALHKRYANGGVSYNKVYQVVNPGTLGVGPGPTATTGGAGAVTETGSSVTFTYLGDINGLPQRVSNSNVRSFSFVDFMKIVDDGGGNMAFSATYAKYGTNLVQKDNQWFVDGALPSNQDKPLIIDVEQRLIGDVTALETAPVSTGLALKGLYIWVLDVTTNTRGYLQFSTSSGSFSSKAKNGLGDYCAHNYIPNFGFHDAGAPKVFNILTIDSDHTKIRTANQSQVLYVGRDYLLVIDSGQSDFIAGSYLLTPIDLWVAGSTYQARDPTTRLPVQIGNANSSGGTGKQYNMDTIYGQGLQTKGPYPLERMGIDRASAPLTKMRHILMPHSAASMLADAPDGYYQLWVNVAGAGWIKIVHIAHSLIGVVDPDGAGGTWCDEMDVLTLPINYAAGRNVLQDRALEWFGIMNVGATGCEVTIQNRIGSHFIRQPA